MAKEKEVNFFRVFVISFLLIVIGLLFNLQIKINSIDTDVNNINDYLVNVNKTVRNIDQKQMAIGAILSETAVPHEPDAAAAVGVQNEIKQ